VPGQQIQNYKLQCQLELKTDKNQQIKEHYARRMLKSFTHTSFAHKSDYSVCQNHTLKLIKLSLSHPMSCFL